MEFVSSIPDLAPTFVALANASSVTEASGLAAFDGRSFAHLVNPQMAPSTPGSDTSLGAWRDAHLVEYFATDSTLSPSPKQIAGHLKDMANNTFIGLRIINSTMNLAYFEVRKLYSLYRLVQITLISVLLYTAQPNSNL